MIKREIFSKIWEKIDSHEILLLNGPRQVGKTTLMNQIKEKLITERKVSPEHIFWFDLEMSEDLLIWSEQTSALSALPINDAVNKYYLFIDEFQKSKTIGSTLKVIHDHYPLIKIIITGSASWYLNIDESLAGRKRVIPIWPLSFYEFLDLPKNHKTKILFEAAVKQIKNTAGKTIEIINGHLLKYLSYGGYPAVITADAKAEKEKILSEIINSYILKDIQLYNYSANTLQVKKILTLLADRVGSLLDINNLALNAGLGRTAMLNRLDLLRNTFILHLLPPYFTNKTKELVKNSKAYLIDSGLKNRLMDNFSLLPQTKYLGQAAENYILAELLKKIGDQPTFFYWRTKTGQEVDFIIKQDNELIPIEVKSGNEQNLPNNLRQFITLYKPKTAFLLNWSVVKDVKFEQCQIKFRPLWFPIF